MYKISFKILIVVFAFTIVIAEMFNLATRLLFNKGFEILEGLKSHAIILGLKEVNLYILGFVVNKYYKVS